ncbi:hypothetical protein E2562_000845 [Oryza meyeriana var. granulata]|uniref:Uncharacterized protein n=1 Tax=Oryza meyeriana var. granulata TaxID=110450 RepID=A0A6G1CWR3_9ORYZ|nr:hypothetical protein E2562_000845 [Oryza meyeriana var. granulata]
MSVFSSRSGVNLPLQRPHYQLPTMGAHVWSQRVSRSRLARGRREFVDHASAAPTRSRAASCWGPYAYFHMLEELQVTNSHNAQNQQSPGRRLRRLVGGAAVNTPRCGGDGVVFPWDVVVGLATCLVGVGVR